MKILISNDDGYQALGIVALYEALKDIAQVEVVAPEQNNSAKSNALTLHSPIYIRTASNGFRYVTGTPADCVHIALTGLLGYKPDLVVSGINNGANMGDDTIYSGTVGAAMEGYLMGVPAIAFSQVDRDWVRIQDAATYAKHLVTQLMSSHQASSSPWLLNVNIPKGDVKLIKGVKVCRQADAYWQEKFDKRTSPLGRDYYWLTGEFINKDKGEDTDEWALANGYVSVVPVQFDLTAHHAIKDINTWNL